MSRNEFWQGKHVFVSGAAGMIGTILVEHLATSGALVLAGDIAQRPVIWPDSVSFYQGDLHYIAPQILKDFQPEVFFHLAARFDRAREPYSFWTANEQDNIQLSSLLMTKLKDLRCLQRVVFASSYLVYDPMSYMTTKLIVDTTDVNFLSESENISPRNLCGAAKYYHEHELSFLSEHCEFSWVAARIFRAYGCGSHDIISRWVRNALKNIPLHVYAPSSRYDFIFADDIALGLLLLAESDHIGPINVGTGRARSINEVVSILQTHFANMRVEMNEKYRHGLLEASCADTKLLGQTIGVMPSIALEEGILKIIAHEKQATTRGSVKRSSCVLVTSVGSKIPLIKALRAAIQRLGSMIFLIGADTNPACLGRNFVNDFALTPPLNEWSTSNMLALCKTYGIDAIIPTRDADVAYFAERLSDLEKKNIAVMASAPSAVALCLDKLRFAHHLEEHELPCIHTTEDVDEVESLRIVVKPRYGSGSRGLALDVNRETAKEWGLNIDTYVYQPFIEGQEYSIDAYIARHGILSIIVRSRDAVRHGESYITTVCDKPMLVELMENVCESIDGLYGHVVLQAIIDEHGAPHVLELNPRFGGASTLSIEAGCLSFDWFLQEAFGSSLRRVPTYRSPSIMPRTMIRVPTDIFVTQEF